MLANELLRPVAGSIRRAELVDVVPAFEYEDGQKTEKVVGYKYVVVLPDFRFEKLSVKIEGAKRIDYSPEQGTLSVKFDKLRLSVYDLNGTVGVSGSAADIQALK